MIYVLYVIVSASSGWTAATSTLSAYPTEMACAAAADKARTAGRSVITYCVRVKPAEQKTTDLQTTASEN